MFGAHNFIPSIMIQGPKIISGFPDDDEDSYYLTTDKLPFEDDDGDNSGLLIERPITDICTCIWQNHDNFFSSPQPLSDKLVSFNDTISSDDSLITFFTRFYIANKPLFDLLSVKLETVLFLAERSIFLLFLQPGHFDKHGYNQLPLIEFLSPSTLQTNIILNLQTIKSSKAPQITVPLFIHALNVLNQGSTVAPTQTKTNPQEPFQFRLSWREHGSSLSLDEVLESAAIPVSESAHSLSSTPADPLVIHASQDQIINNDALIEWKTIVFDYLLRWRYSLESTLGLGSSDTALNQEGAFTDPPEEVASPSSPSSASPSSALASDTGNVLLESIEKLHSTSDIITIIPIATQEVTLSCIIETLAESLKSH